MRHLAMGEAAQMFVSVILGFIVNIATPAMMESSIVVCERMM